MRIFNGISTKIKMVFIHFISKQCEVCKDHVVGEKMFEAQHTSPQSRPRLWKVKEYFCTDCCTKIEDVHKWLESHPIDTGPLVGHDCVKVNRKPPVPPAPKGMRVSR